MVQYTLSSTTPLPHRSLFSKKGVNKYIHCETYLQQWVFIDEWEGKELKDVLGKRTRKKTWRVIGTLFLGCCADHDDDDDDGDDETPIVDKDLDFYSSCKCKATMWWQTHKSVHQVFNFFFNLSLSWACLSFAYFSQGKMQQVCVYVPRR